MKKSVLLFTVLLSQTLWGQMRTEDNVFVDSQQSTAEISVLDRSTSIFFEDFQDGIPTDWNRYVGLMDDILNGGAFQTGQGGNPWQLLNPTSYQFMPGDGLDTRHITISTLTSSVKNWLVTSYKTVPANSYLSFDASFNKHQSADVPDLSGTDDKFAILYQIGNGNWQLLAKWDNQGSEKVLNSIDQFPQTITLPLTNTQNASIRIAFYAESTVANTNNVIHVDNIGIWASSGSPAPSNIYVTEKSKNSALINWDMPEGANTCNLQYKKVNDFSAWNTIPFINVSSYMLTGLEPETYYRVRLCSNNAQGEGYWSESIVFRTALDHDNYSIPCKEIFTSASVPTNWKIFTDPVEYALSYGGYHPKQPKPGTPTSGRWSIIGGYYSFGAYHARIYCFGSNTSWLITPNIDLSTAFHPENLSLVFDIAKTAEYSNAAPPTNLPDNDDEFRVLISTDGGETWLPENCTTWKKSGGDHSFSEISNTGTTIRIPLNEYANGTVMIGFYCGSKTGNNGFELHIDNVFIGEANHIFLTEGSWTDAENWKDNSVPSSMDDCVLLKADATVPANSVAQAGCISMMFGSLTIEDGGQLYHSNEGVEATIKKNINGYSGDGNGWNLICHPMDAEILADDINNLKSGTYDLYSFDINEELEWRNFKLFSNQLTSLNAIEGYLYANSQNQTLSFTGVLNAANAITIDDLKYNGNARLKGFNLIGNPFACNAIVNKPMYVMNDAHDNIIAVSNYEIAPNEAVFVSVSSNNRTVTIMPAYLNQANGNGDGICIEVRKADNTRGQGVLDRARINFSEQDNLEKYTLNANATKLYIPFEGEDFAVLQAQQEGEMPINFKAENNGNYVLNIYPENSKMGYLHLIDNLTGIDTDLLENPNYTFDAKTTDFASRFKLVYSVNGYEDNLENFAYCSGNTLKINSQGDAMIQVIDILGHVISSETISGSCDKELNLCPGVYVLRMVSNNGVKTQKIVLQ